VRCTTLQVPLDYRRPAGPRETVELSRQVAGDPVHRLGVLITAPGGPGASSKSETTDQSMAVLAAQYDLIGIAPRGVGASQPLLCEGISVTGSGEKRPTDAQMRAFAEKVRQQDQACERANGPRRPFFTTANNARDLDVVRAVLGESRLNLMGQSYGTYTTAVYGALFPNRLNRSVLDSAMHPRWIGREQWKQQPIAQRRTADAWMDWVSQRHQVFGLGTSRTQVHAAIEDLRAKLEAHPVSRDDYEYDGDALDGVIGATNEVEYWDYFASTVRRLQTEVETPSTVPADLGRALDTQHDMLADEPVTSSGVKETTNCEAVWPTALETYFADMRYFAEHYPYGWGATGAAPHECTFGSVQPVEPLVPLHRASYPTGLVVQEEFDPQTPYQGGLAMAELLGHRLVSVPQDGYHVAYPSGNECVVATVNDYFLNGKLPSPGFECTGTPIPDVPADGSPEAGEAQPPLDEQTRAVRARLR
jgi:pimeloyl-ACP methyl ester carboxylesterase